MTKVISQVEPADLRHEIIATTMNNPHLPAKYDKARYKVERGIMGKDYTEALRRFLWENRGMLELGGDGDRRRNWEIADIEHVCPDLISPLRAEIESRMEGALKVCGVDKFDIHWTELHAICHHEGQQFQWHTDHFESSNVRRPETRTMTFTYYFRTKGDNYDGGQLEFFDGTLIDPRDDMLVWCDPYQCHRVRKVSMKSRQLMDARWAIIGWVHCREEDIKP